MAEFFRGWKRKLGVAALLVACVLVAGWIRSYGANDTLELDFAGIHHGSSNYEPWMIPYWSVILPLAILSAWLLFSKPRKS